MANERQIAANRRKAKKSTGPQTDGGKKRAGRNAFRHGLAARMSLSDTVANQLEELARSIAANTESPIKLACARAAAEALLGSSTGSLGMRAVYGDRLCRRCSRCKPSNADEKSRLSIGVLLVLARASRLRLEHVARPDRRVRRNGRQVGEQFRMLLHHHEDMLRLYVFVHVKSALDEP
jgi:hypothetical protein